MTESLKSSPIICVHLDLKGVAFRPSYIPQLMRDLASQGINSVLVEYEDVFPFIGMDIAFDPPTVWSEKTLKLFKTEAAKNGIEIIPLQQCLGHLEYLFRWKKYVKYAEDKSYPSTLNITDSAGKALIKEMLRQIIEAHPDSRFVHLGMDEAHGLHKTAKRAGRPILELFIEYLHELLEVAEKYGKTPIIWSDMLEDHFLPGIFDDIKDRVILAPWDYSTAGKRSKTGRIHGSRISKEWLNEPDNPDAPAIGAGTQFFEDLPENAVKQIEEYRHGREIDSFYQVEMWTKLGFRVIGSTAIRVSSSGSILPDFSLLKANINSWAQVIKRNKQLGLIGTSWARGTTFCPPNFNIDLSWPCIAELASAMGANPEPFFPGIPTDTLDGILAKLSRCRKDWSIEESIGAEMVELEPQLTKHSYEWHSLQLMIKALALHRQIDFACLEVDFFRAGGRPVTPEWQRRIDDQTRVIKELHSLRALVKKHFGKRCEGAHFNEWVAHLFDVNSSKMKSYVDYSRSRLKEAKKCYGW